MFSRRGKNASVITQLSSELLLHLMAKLAAPQCFTRLEDGNIIDKLVVSFVSKEKDCLDNTRLDKE